MWGEIWQNELTDSGTCRCQLSTCDAIRSQCFTGPAEAGWLSCSHCLSTQQKGGRGREKKRWHDRRDLIEQMKVVKRRRPIQGVKNQLPFTGTCSLSLHDFTINPVLTTASITRTPIPGQTHLHPLRSHSQVENPPTCARYGSRIVEVDH